MDKYDDTTYKIFIIKQPEILERSKHTTNGKTNRNLSLYNWNSYIISNIFKLVNVNEKKYINEWDVNFRFKKYR